MALLHPSSVDPTAVAEGRGHLADEIIDLTDRRRVMLRAVFGMDVEPDFADAVFDADET
jgi:type III secretion system FlhB-like substrate exporter